MDDLDEKVGLMFRKTKLDKVLELPSRGWCRITHIASWLPVLWRDWDWDSGFLMTIIAFKLKRMENHFETHHIISDWGKVRDEIHLARLLLDRLQKDDYCSEDYQEHWKKFGQPGHNAYTNEQGHTVWPSTAGTPEGDDSKRISNKWMELEKQDWEMFWDLLKKKSKDWWD